MCKVEAHVGIRCRMVLPHMVRSVHMVRIVHLQVTSQVGGNPSKGKAIAHFEFSTHAFPDVPSMRQLPYRASEPAISSVIPPAVPYPAAVGPEGGVVRSAPVTSASPATPTTSTPAP